MTQSDNPVLALGNVQRRATIFVQDMERSLDFYTRVIGYTVYHERATIMPADAPFPVGKPGTERPGRFVIVKGDHDLMGMIGLLWYEQKLENHHCDRLGYGHVVLVLQTTDATALEKRLIEYGSEFVKPLSAGKNTGDLDGNQIDSTSMFVRDPDGYLLEIYQPA